MFYLYYSVSRVTEVMKRVDAAKICSGNPDNKYAVLHTILKGHFMDSSGALMFKTWRKQLKVISFVYLIYRNPGCGISGV